MFTWTFNQEWSGRGSDMLHYVITQMIHRRHTWKKLMSLRPSFFFLLRLELRDVQIQWSRWTGEPVHDWTRWTSIFRIEIDHGSSQSYFWARRLLACCLQCPMQCCCPIAGWFEPKLSGDVAWLPESFRMLLSENSIRKLSGSQATSPLWRYFKLLGRVPSICSSCAQNASCHGLLGKDI